MPKSRVRDTGAALILALLWGQQAAMAAIPLPRPRPAEAPPRDAEEKGTADRQDENGADEKSVAVDKPAQPPQPTPCRLALTSDIAIAPSIPAIHGPGACGGDDLVRLEAVMVSPTQRVVLKPAATLRCTMATAIANWVREDAAPLALSQGSPLIGLDNYDSYECRGRNRVKGAQLSEHGKANALDVRSLNLANGTILSLTDRHLSRDVREKVLASVCARFMTVLGPGSDWYHEEHIHLDLAERRNNYKLCHWGVYDPMPEVAPLMPAERPAEAPPRLDAASEAATPATSAPSSESNAPAQDSPAIESPVSAKPARSKPSSRRYQ